MQFKREVRQAVDNDDDDDDDDNMVSPNQTGNPSKV
jgi:hypothetical protein